MNKVNQKQLAAIAQKLDDMKADINNILENEQCAFDEHSENWQESDRGEAEQEMLEALENAINDLDDAIKEELGK